MYKTLCALALIGVCAAAAEASGATITAAPRVTHPKSTIDMSGSGFAPGEAIDIYLDTTDKLLVVADTTGGFEKRVLAVDGGVLPGLHWITAVGRKDGNASQVGLNVRTDWSERGFGLHGKRFNPYENVIGAGNAAQLDVAWKTPLGGSVGSSPVYNGMIFVGCEDAKFYAFTAEGAFKWSMPTNGGVSVAPAISGNTVYAVSHNGGVYAFRTTTGAMLWSKQLADESYSAPLVGGGRLYTSDGTGKVYAFDAATGASVWTAALGGLTIFSGALSDGLLFFGNQNNAKLTAVDAATGAVKWSSQLVDQIYSPPAVANGLVYVGSEDSRLHALRVTDGVEQWASALLGAHVRAAPAVAYGLVYAGSEDGNLYAFRANTGQTAWTAQIGSPVETSPAVANGVVYAGGTSGKVFAFNALSGGQLWGATTGDTINSSPTVVDGMLLVGSYDKNLYAFELDAGNDAAYRRSAEPPALATLRPDRRLKPSP
ncbi:MAG: PQQ-binding-like beta-propeller repeat protein [Alphaproteobacteria bacterium]|nr:PQQ-binding-like beta-propeller repeat protein [Alphaproteobacteria bacterium]